MDGEPLVILLVEDDPDHAELFLRSLSDNRVANRIFHVSDGERALHVLFRQGEFADPETSPQPELILLDLRLPKIDGLEVLRQIKTSDQLPRIPVVILTSSGAERDIAEAYGSHANSYLVKPVDFDKFNKLIDDLNFYWLAWNRAPNF